MESSMMHKIDDEDEPWNDPTSKKGWQMWHEPWFRLRHPIMFRINAFLERRFGW
jgi:hypothetical protein